VSRLVEVITAEDAQVRDRSLDAVCAGLSVAELLAECDALDGFRRASGNLYERVRALFFLYAIHRFHMPLHDEAAAPAAIPFAGYTKLLKRRFEEAIDIFLAAQAEAGAGAAISSALAAAYRGLGFQTLAGQVRHSVRSVRGNQWMFRIGHPADYPLRLRPELLRTEGGMFPLLRESTPVRMDLTHSGWSDIFFLGMDFPEGARVINISVDLAVRGGAGAGAPKPPVEAYLRVIDQPVLRLTSVDLQATAEISTIAAEGRGDRLGAGAAGDGGRDTAAGTPSGAAHGSARAGDRNRQQGEWDSEGLAAGGLDDVAGEPDCGVHAGYRAGAVARRRIDGRRAEVGGGARDLGRVAGRVWRRLAGFRRGVAGHQADSWRGGGGGRCGIRSEPRMSAAAASHFRRRRDFRRNAGVAAIEFGAGARRHGAGCRADSRDGDGAVFAAVGERVDGAARGDGDSR
jgi:hypothetical protein